MIVTSGQTANANYITFGVTRSGIKPTQRENVNSYTINTAAFGNYLFYIQQELGL
jgi:hypothetical protein